VEEDMLNFRMLDWIDNVGLNIIKKTPSNR